MKVIKPVNNAAVKRIFELQGWETEHNFYHYMNTGVSHESCFFPVFEGKYGIMAFENKGVMWCYTDSLAPKNKALKFFMEFLEWAFEQGAKKVRAEIREELWKAVVKNVKTGGYRAIKPSYVYSWPVYDLKAWDPNLSGAAFKKLRNIRNRFQQNYKINILGREETSKNDILRVFKRWEERRKGDDKTHMECYKAPVKNGFVGYDSVRLIEIDGRICAINGGWKIPNSNIFYSQLGLHHYSMPNLGDFCYIEDLTFLKESGYEFANFGGSTPAMMVFKNKFFPTYVYKTIEFSIVKK